MVVGPPRLRTAKRRSRNSKTSRPVNDMLGNVAKARCWICMPPEANPNHRDGDADPSFQSRRKLLIGSTRAARRAGTNDARTATKRISEAVTTIVKSPAPLTPRTRLSKTLAAVIPTSVPSATPTAPRTKPRTNTMRMTAWVCAPNAYSCLSASTGSACMARRAGR